MLIFISLFSFHFISLFLCLLYLYSEFLFSRVLSSSPRHRLLQVSSAFDWPWFFGAAVSQMCSPRRTCIDIFAGVLIRWHALIRYHTIRVRYNSASVDSCYDMSIFSYHGILANTVIGSFIATYLPRIKVEPSWPTFLLLITFTTTLLLFDVLSEPSPALIEPVVPKTGTWLINSRSILFHSYHIALSPYYHS